MAKHQRKVEKRLAARRAAYVSTGPSPKHEAKVPGSQNLRK